MAIIPEDTLISIEARTVVPCPTCGYNRTIGAHRSIPQMSIGIDQDLETALVIDVVRSVCETLDILAKFYATRTDGCPTHAMTEPEE